MMAAVGSGCVGVLVQSPSYLLEDRPPTYKCPKAFTQSGEHPLLV